jgi:hypothetical protein
MIEGRGWSDCLLAHSRKKGELMKNMNKVSKRLLMIITTIAMIASCIYAGQTEYNDEVLSGMSAEKYQYIHDSLGCRASQDDVVKEYIANQKYYDSKNY